MSSNQPPYDPRERWSHEDDLTRQQDLPPGGGDPGSGQGEDATQYLDPVDAGPPGRAPLEATVDHGQGGLRPSDDPYRRHDPRSGHAAVGPDGYDDEPEPRRKWGKGTLLVLLGIVLGFLIGLVVVALGTDDTTPTTVESEVAMERIAELEAELGERDAQIADLEARLAEADAEAGEADEAVAEQRAALENLSSELDARSNALNEREQALAQREQELAAREAAVEERERAVDEGEPAPDDDGTQLPDIDDEDVEGFIDQVLERIRDLF